MATAITLNLNKKAYHDSSDSDDEDPRARLSEEDEKNDEEKELENIVFGSESCIVSNIDRLRRQKGKKTKKFKPIQVVDDEDEAEVEPAAEKAATTPGRPKQIADNFQERKPVWQDAADDEMVDLDKFNQFKSVVGSHGKSQVSSAQIEESLKARFSKYYGTPMWADLDAGKKSKKKKKSKKPTISGLTDRRQEAASDDEEAEESADSDSDNDDATNVNLMQQTTGNYLKENRGVKGSLPKSVIDIKQCTDANKEEPHQARLKSVEFHPTARVLLTAGLNQTLSLFQIDGKKNAKIQTIFIDKYPILAAHFTKNGEEIIMGSRHKSFYYYDMIAGKIVNVTPPVKAIDEFQRRSISAHFEISPDNRFIAFVGSQGQIHLFSVKSKEWIDTLKINDSCNAITFSADSRYLFAFGDDKDVHVFDLNDRGHRSLHKFTDYGCLSGTSIAVSSNSQYLATGCKSGVVNLYDLNDSLLRTTRNPKPVKSFKNLTTPCTSLKFNSTNEILAMCSSHYENACKLVHVGSMTVFGNFPLRNESSTSTQIRIPQCVDFSLNSGYFTIGNQKGNALLYRLKHYGSY